jgi:hypothetical protein
MNCVSLRKKEGKIMNNVNYIKRKNGNNTYRFRNIEEENDNLSKVFPILISIKLSNVSKKQYTQYPRRII